MTNKQISGSHDSCAYLSKESSILSRLFAPFCVCQSKSISEQLAAGVRAFDIRCKIYKGEVWCYHGVARFNRLKTVMESLAYFSKSNPDEILLIGFGREDRGALLLKYSDQQLWDAIVLTAYSAGLSLQPLTSETESDGGCYVTGFYRLKIDFGLNYKATGVSVKNYGCSVSGVLEAVNRLLEYQWSESLNFIYTNSPGGLIPLPKRWARLFNKTAAKYVNGKSCIWYRDFV
ncbi:MAG: hypothetical protein PHV20_12240 [Bacteroidales bacterium]|nr:hypothetical protein [Bacteroidales bacterium]